MVHEFSATNNGSVLEHAIRYVRSELSVIPIKPDGSKTPAGDVLPREPGEDGIYRAAWKPFQQRLPNDDELERWFADGRRGPAVVAGAVSGCLEIIDFDDAELFDPWCELVEGEFPGLLQRLTVTRTPRPGYQAAYRCPDVEIPGNQKLASRSNQADPKKLLTLIETRGEGGYFLAVGCPEKCHPNGLYRHHSGPPLEAVQSIGWAERDCLLRCAAVFDESPADDSPWRFRASNGALRPGEDYARRGPDWAELLDPHGWTCVRQKGAVRFWKRPGKDAPGWSATTGHCKSKSDGRELFAVFSSNADPFPGPEGGRVCSVHDKFAVYALLNHDGDFKEAAKVLAGQGFGDQQQKGSQGRGAKPKPTPEVAGLEVRMFAGVEIEPVTYLVAGYIPQNKVTLFAGVGGIGKSVATVDLAAAVSTGRPAFGLCYNPPEPADVLLFTGEDDAADTVGPRLLAAGADLSRVGEVRGLIGKDGKRLPFSLADGPSLAAALRQRPHVRLVVIDPVGVFVGRTGVDSHKEAPCQALLGDLRELAAEFNVAVVLVAHLNKSEEGRARNRVSGSAAFVNSARAAFLFTEDPTEGVPDGQRLFLPLKFNAGVEPSGLAFGTRPLTAEEVERVMPALQHLPQERRELLLNQLFRLDWRGTTTATADEVLAKKKDRGAGKVDQAGEWLKRFLAKFAYPSEEVIQAGVRVGHTKDNLYRAKAKLRDEIWASNKGAFRSSWWWGLGPSHKWTRRPDSAVPTEPTAETAESAESADTADTDIIPFHS